MFWGAILLLGGSESLRTRENAKANRFGELSRETSKVK